MTEQRETLEDQIAAARDRVRELEAELNSQRTALREAQLQEQRIRVEGAVHAAVMAPRSEFFSDLPHYDGERPYVLPFGREAGKWNPRDVENAYFGKEWLTGMMALICKRVDEPRSFPTRLIFTSGSTPPESDRIGMSFTARHDQTNAKLGEYEIVGIVVYGFNGDVVRTEGDVPDRKLSQNTYK